MSKNILLITPEVLKKRTALHENVDDKLIYPEIKTAQDMHVMPLLGTTLFNKIIADIDAGVLIGDYKLLMDDYVIDCLMNFVLSGLAVSLTNQYFNKGITATPTDNAQVNSNTDNLTISAKYRAAGEFYAQRTRSFIQQNQAKYPEFYAVRYGIDSLPPSPTTFTLPMYLGSDCDILPQISYNKCYPR